MKWCCRSLVKIVTTSRRSQRFSSTTNVSLFYDNYEEASLWGKNLTEHLHKVYSGSARYCVMFISKHYAEKVWPTHERRSAFEKGDRVEGRAHSTCPIRRH